MKKSILSVFALAAILVSCNEQKLAYVDTSKVIEEYKEMKDVEAEFTSKSDAVRNQLDSIGQAFQQEVQADSLLSDFCHWCDQHLTGVRVALSPHVSA